MAGHHTGDRSRTHLRGDVGAAAPARAPSQPTGILRWTSSHGRPGGERHAVASADPMEGPVWRRPLGEPRTAEPTTIPSPPGPNSGSDDPATRRSQRHLAPRCAQRWAAPPHRRMPGSSAVRTAPTPPRPRSPQACLSGHQDRAGRVDTGRVDTGRPPDQWTDVRPADSGPGHRDQWRVRRPDILDGHLRLGWAQTPLGLPRLRRSAIHDGSAVTTPAAAAVTAAATDSRAAPLGRKPRLGALLSCVGFGWYERRAMGLRKVRCAGWG